MTRKICVWCWVSFYDKRPNTFTCGFQCADARYQEKCRMSRYQKRAPLLYLRALERERAALHVTWENIDALFAETFSYIHRP